MPNCKTQDYSTKLKAARPNRFHLSQPMAQLGFEIVDGRECQFGYSRYTLTPWDLSRKYYPR